jgi:hypothetical protein
MRSVWSVRTKLRILHKPERWLACCVNAAREMDGIRALWTIRMDMGQTASPEEH